ncbi:MAG TPA: NAD-dependent epimerase/dehydratase family protein [Candidatus Dormibacteraeota bacterium]|nr:NAD-dependent epimerase/dehydratase family protein [Candidatus Dormibacteraeota bacterium]
MKQGATPGRVAVTGGAGFIGTHTVRRLLELRTDTLVIDDFRHACPEPVPAAVTLVREEISSPAARQALLDFQPEAIIHLAAQGGVNRSLKDPAADAIVNVVGTVALLRAAVDAKCPRIVFASSGGAIYGSARRLPSREGDRAKPLSPYGAAKLACEGYLGMFSRTFGLHFVALRYGNVYGPFQDGTGEAGVVAITSNRLRRGLPAQITGDGGQTRDFTYVADVAAANVAALTTGFQGPLNIGTGHATSVAEVVTTLAQAAGFPGPAEYVDGRPGEVRSNYLSPARAARHLPWEALVGLREGLTTTYQSFAGVS